MKDWRGTTIEVGAVVTTGHAGRQIEGVVIEAVDRDPRGTATAVLALTEASNGVSHAGARMRVRADRLTVVQTAEQVDAAVAALIEAAGN